MQSVQVGLLVHHTAYCSLLIDLAGDENCIQNFGEAWIQAFRLTHVYTVWNQMTDPALFDICEPR